MACRFPHPYGRERENNQPRSLDTLMNVGPESSNQPGRNRPSPPPALAHCANRARLFPSHVLLLLQSNVSVVL